MELWFWVFSWFLYILTIVENGFVIFLVCRKRQLRTETNTFIVSFAVADFALGVIAVPLHFLCNMINECISNKNASLSVMYVWVFILYASRTNSSSLVLERYIAVVKPFKYLTLTLVSICYPK